MTLKHFRLHRLRHGLALLSLAWTLGGVADAAQAASSHRTTSHAGTAQASSAQRAAKHKSPAAKPGAKPSTQPAKAKSASHRAAPRSGQHAAKPGKAAPRVATAASGARPGSAARGGLDYSGRKRVGKASFYSGRFAGRKMADGTRLRMHHPVAASKTLPLGTVAKVTNLRTGKSAVVQIRDRGPFVKGRIVDLTPATARAVGLTAQEGVAPVEVTPIRVPLPDGSVKAGEAAHDPLARTLVARAQAGE